jgi:HAE1 family hydrophobic/amphiphilic exporter-1
MTTSGGVRLALGDVADLEPREGAREIFRRDQKRVARVTARVDPGSEYPQAREAAEEALASLEPVPGLLLRLAGEEEERARTVGELTWAALLAALLVFMVLAGAFESLRQPFAVLASLPLAAVGVAAILVPLGHPIGVMAILGLIVLGGIAVNDAILLAETARRLGREGLGRSQALARAAGLRFRPILMTTATTVLALLPLAFGAGEGAALRAPLAMTLVGGLVASTLAALFVIPCLLELLFRGRGSR